MIKNKKKKVEALYDITKIAFVLSLIDVSQTIYALSLPGIEEANVIVLKFMETFGVGPGIFLSHLFLVSVMIWGFYIAKDTNKKYLFYVIYYAYSLRVFLSLFVILNNFKIIGDVLL